MAGNRKFNAKDYAEVKDRIAEFYLEFPDGLIQTFLHENAKGVVVMEARVYRSPDDIAKSAYTSGFAREVEGGSYVNETSHLENAETSAIGRALANMGYGTKKNRPSREEMLKTARAEKLHDRLLDYIRDNWESVPEDVEVEIEGTTVKLARYIQDKGEAIRDRLSLARAVVTEMERILKLPFTEGKAA